MADVGRSRPPTRLSRVDSPEPDGPMMETISPRGITRLTSSSVVTWRLPSNRSATILQFDHRGAGGGRCQSLLRDREVVLCSRKCVSIPHVPPKPHGHIFASR